MRRFASRVAAFAVLGALFAPAVQAASHGSTSHGAAASKSARRAEAAPAASSKAAANKAGPGQPPHAWLFGTWTGGLFPAPSDVTAEACLAQPVVIFTRDIVLHATLTDQLYIQRVVETALATSGGTQFRFAATPGVAAPGAGFGCGDPDGLIVERKSDNQITFPGCGDFPNPLVRCPSR